MAVSKAEILDAIAGMTVLDLSELIKEMEVKFGVSAAAAAVAAAAHHQHGAGLSAAGQHHRAQGSRFGAQALGVGGVFHVTARMDVALRVKHGSTDGVVGIRRIGLALGLARGG